MAEAQETETTQTPEATEAEKKPRTSHVKGQPHPKLQAARVRPYNEGKDENIATPLGVLKTHFHPTGVAEYPLPNGEIASFPYKTVSPGDSSLINHTALIASVRAMDKRRTSKKDGNYTTDDAIEEGCLEEYLQDVQNEREYICRVVAAGLTDPEQQMTWEEVPENLDKPCMVFLFSKMLGGAVPAQENERVERFPSEDEPSQNGAEVEASTD